MDARAPPAWIGAQLDRAALPQVLRPYPDDPLGEDRPPYRPTGPAGGPMAGTHARR